MLRSNLADSVKVLYLYHMQRPFGHISNMEEATRKHQSQATAAVVMTMVMSESKEPFSLSEDLLTFRPTLHIHKLETSQPLVRNVEVSVKYSRHCTFSHNSDESVLLQGGGG